MFHRAGASLSVPEALLDDLETAKEVIAEQAAHIAWLERHFSGQSSEKNLLPQPARSGPQLDVFSERGEVTPQAIKKPLFVTEGR